MQAEYSAQHILCNTKGKGLNNYLFWLEARGKRRLKYAEI
jgi:hypothetical protein